MNPVAYEPLKSKFLNRSEKMPADCLGATAVAGLGDHFEIYQLRAAAFLDFQHGELQQSGYHCLGLLDKALI